MIERRAALGAAVLACLGGCAAAEKAVVRAAAAEGVTAAMAANFFGFVKGAAEIAQLAEPAYAPIIAAALDEMTPAMAAIMAGLAQPSDVSTVVSAGVALVAAIGTKVRIIPSAA